ncbi:hypothetical protein EES47_22550 [Streptomyces sp. ADI98-12]|nr:hypothetical protein EES47_22550 [Streptomyces sp. ADI98-12]
MPGQGRHRRRTGGQQRRRGEVGRRDDPAPGQVLGVQHVADDAARAVGRDRHVRRREVLGTGEGVRASGRHRVPEAGVPRCDEGAAADVRAPGGARGDADLDLAGGEEGGDGRPAGREAEGRGGRARRPHRRDQPRRQQRLQAVGDAEPEDGRVPRRVERRLSGDGRLLTGQSLAGRGREARCPRRCRPAGRPDGERVTEELPQPPEGRAHRRPGHVLLGGPGDVPLPQQDREDHQQVQGVPAQAARRVVGGPLDARPGGPAAGARPAVAVIRSPAHRLAPPCSVRARTRTPAVPPDREAGPGRRTYVRWRVQGSTSRSRAPSTASTTVRTAGAAERWGATPKGSNPSADPPS